MPRCSVRRTPLIGFVRGSLAVDASNESVNTGTGPCDVEAHYHPQAAVSSTATGLSVTAVSPIAIGLSPIPCPHRHRLVDHCRISRCHHLVDHCSVRYFWQGVDCRLARYGLLPLSPPAPLVTHELCPTNPAFIAVSITRSHQIVVPIA
ncbi:hypothetical protein J6590_049997 [Homalodisca vitripennis]|nr:hypothetical protein J6590_049997 [Homalodisca vitripennis]